VDIKKFHNKYGHCLGETSTEDFLNQYWQKKPLLIRNAFHEIESPISAEELAGLACEEHVNARIVLESSGNKPWEVEFGPFDESRFSTLPKSNWSLLVSDIEKYLPETRSLLKPFRFIPDWRIDDLMISYAPTGGSVGAHTDAYDVFLLQLSGQRLWQISENFSDDIIPNLDLRILKNFTTEQEWLLNPGDMLYLPPNIAHYGVAEKSTDAEPCMTASIGFRAPSLATVSNEYIHYQSTNNQRYKTSRYTDKVQAVQSHHAEITDNTVAEFMDFLKQGMTIEAEQVKRWLGHYYSDNKTFDDFIEPVTYEQPLDYDELIVLAKKSFLIQSPYSHFLFSKDKTEAILFVNGDEYKVSQKFAELMCDEYIINLKSLKKIVTENDKHILTALFNNGAIIISTIE
jgi:50S ribosomal protein L16 3-hydroxylase